MRKPLNIMGSITGRFSYNTPEMQPIKPAGSFRPVIEVPPAIIEQDYSKLEQRIIVICHAEAGTPEG